MKPVEDHVPCPLSRERERAGVRVPAIDHARSLRQNQTDAEALLWRHLRGRRLQGFKFRRQHPLGPFTLDFVCLDAGLVIELDGGQHAEDQAYDARRTAVIEQHGLRVIRFWNHEVLNQTPAALERIWQALQALTPTLSRSRERAPHPSRDPRVGQDTQESP